MEPYLGWIVWIVTALALISLFTREKAKLANAQDRIEELEQLSEELLRANKGKSDFLANISHEIRTPLNTITGYAELLGDGVYGELTPRQKKAVNRVESSTNHLRLLVDQILDLAKIAAGRMDVYPEPLNIRPFLLDIATEIEPLVAEKKLHMSLSISTPNPPLSTDPGHLRQIIVNLISNAIKYTEKGSISIIVKPYPVGHSSVPQHLRSQEERLKLVETFVKPIKKRSSRGTEPGTAWVAIQVLDTGMGIAPADHERIFDEFIQINPTSQSSQSTGLGLPISRKLARLLQGDVIVDSDIARGASFTVWLPHLVSGVHPVISNSDVHYQRD